MQTLTLNMHFRLCYNARLYSNYFHCGVYKRVQRYVSYYTPNMDKSKRSPNFSTAELTVMTEEVEKRREKIYNKFNTTVSNSLRKRAWEEIASKINEVNDFNRTVSEVKKKWSSLQSAAKKRASQNRREAMKTGGGPPPNDLSVLEDKIVTIIGETAIESVEGGVDTLENTNDKDYNNNEDVTPESNIDNGTAIEDNQATISRKRRSERKIDDESAKIIKIEMERLDVEKERLEVEKQRLDIDKERLNIEKETLRIKKEKHALYLNQLGLQEVQLISEASPQAQSQTN